MHVEKKVDSNGFIVCRLSTPIRQKAWHSPMVEDAEGRSLFLAISVEVAQQIVTAINQSQRKARSPMYKLHFHATVSERPYKHTATELRLTTDTATELQLTTGDPVAEFRSFATLAADSGSASLFFYLAQAELRALAAAMVEAAERLEELAQEVAA